MADSESTTGKAPAFQFYPKDYLSDARVRALTFKQRGMYWDLVSHCWLEHALPEDPVEVARILGITVPGRFVANDWPVISRCFRLVAGEGWHHKRLDEERQKQLKYREQQSQKGRASGAARSNRKATGREPNANHGSTAPGSVPVEPNTKSSSPISDLQSPDCSQTVPAASARSKRPIFRCERFAVFEWMLDDIRQMLGPNYESFDVHEWFYTLSDRANAAELVVPQRDGGKWLLEQTLAEAQRRGLPVADTATAPRGDKTVQNLGNLQRFAMKGVQA